jgi:hypothetical protein
MIAMKRDYKHYDISLNLEIPSVVPEFIDKRIDSTLRNLEQRKKNRKFAKKTVPILVACITIISLGAITAFGQSVPILNSLVKFVNPSAAKNYESVKVDITDNNGTSAIGSGKTVVNKKATDKGITLTVNDLSYDGASLIVGFDLSKPGGFGSAVTEIDTDLLPYFQNPKDGTPSSLKNLVADSYLIKKDNGDYHGYASFYFGDPATNIREDYTLTLTASNISVVNGQAGLTEVNGLWKIGTGLSEKDIYTAAQTTESNVVHPIKNGKVDSVKIIRSTLDNIISLKGTYNTMSASLQTQGFFILDDKGNCLNYKYILQDGAFNSVISLMRIPSDTQKLTVIPYTSLKGKEILYSADITKLPVSIKMQGQEINISDIERSQGNLIMHYTISGLTDNREFTYFEFEDKNGNKINPLGPPTRIMSPLDYETGQGTYELKTDRSEDIAKVIIHGQEYVIQNDHKFDINLK